MKILVIFVISFVFLCTSSVSAQQSETEKAVALYRNGDFNSALNILKAVVEADKKDRKAWVYLGGCYVRSQNEKLAREAFKKAELLVPKKHSPEDNTKFNDSLKITSKPRVPYGDKARAEGIQGTVKLAIEFGADGKIKFIFPVQTLMFGLTEASLESAKNIRFIPAQKDGEPITTVAVISYNFALSTGQKKRKLLKSLYLFRVYLNPTETVSQTVEAKPENALFRSAMVLYFDRRYGVFQFSCQ